VQVYKKGQGSAARWIAAAALGAMAGFGCYELRQKVSEWTAASLNLGVVSLSVSVLVGGATFVIALLLIGMLVNLPKFVDYLIVSEVELRKVSWPTRAELKRQTTVVIVTLLIFSAILLAADAVFSHLSLKLLIGK
jgi:preprotein translocase SecE subunit